MVNDKGSGSKVFYANDTSYSSRDSSNEAKAHEYVEDEQSSTDASGIGNLRDYDRGKRHERYKPRNNAIASPSKVENNSKVLPRSKSSTSAMAYPNDSDERKFRPTSYVKLVKQTEDEMELVRRRQTPRQATTSQFSGDHKDEFKTKRRSANSVTLLFGRGKRVPDATDITPRRANVRGADSEVDSSDTEVGFPLRSIVADEGDDNMSIRQAKSLENAAKRRTKTLKNEVGVAKLEVMEAKLSEFSATLEVRQAKIEERQAKLCRRRAALKKAEEEQDMLERKMDEKEEDHRARERRIKNRERRVKQEEAGILLKEASLRKRELAITQGIDKIETWRKIIDEKEEMQKRMEEIVEKKEDLHGRDTSSSAVFGTLGKLLKRTSRDNGSRVTHSSNNQRTKTYPIPNVRSSVSSGNNKSNSGLTQPRSEKLNRNMPNAQNGKRDKHAGSNTTDVKSGALSLWI